MNGSTSQVAVIGLYVHSYFCYRLYIISGTAYVVAPVAIIFLFAFLSVVIAVRRSYTLCNWACIAYHFFTPQTYYITADKDPAIGHWCALSFPLLRPHR